MERSEFLAAGRFQWLSVGEQPTGFIALVIVFHDPLLYAPQDSAAGR